MDLDETPRQLGDSDSPGSDPSAQGAQEPPTRSTPLDLSPSLDGLTSSGNGQPTPQAEPEASSVKVEFRRDMRLLDITMIGIGAMIGAGIFVLSGIAAGYAGPACILAFILNGIINLITGMMYAELGSAYPEAGGGYLWVRKGLPPPFGFVSGWISWFGHTVACGLYALGFGAYMDWLLSEYHVNPFPANDIVGPEKIIAVIVAVILLYVNYRGTAATGKSEIFFTASKLILLVIFIGLGAFAMVHNPTAIDNLFGNFFPNGGGGILYAMSLTLIAFQGYEVIAQTGEEVKDPKKNIPRAIFISLLFVTVIYVGIVVVLFGIVTNDIMSNAGSQSPSEYLGTAGSSGELALVEIAKAAIGPVGIAVILLGGFLSTLSALNATIFSSSRVSFAMGRDGTLPKALGDIHPKRRTPHNAIAISGVILLIMVLVFPIKTVAGSADVMFLVLFAITNAAGIALRYKMPHLDRGFKVPLFPVLSTVGIILNIALIYPLFLIEPLAVYLGMIWIMIGAYVYFFTGAKKDILDTPFEVKEMAGPLTKEKAERFRILIPVAFMEEHGLVDFGGAIAKSKDGDISLLNIIEVPQNTPTSALRYGEVSEQIQNMEKVERHAKQFDIDVDARLLISHEVADTILDAVKTENIDLLLMGWHGKSRRGFIMGTNIDRIVASANTDVVLFKWEGLKPKIKEVTLLYGGGIHVERAAELAALFGQHYGAEAVVLHVAEHPAGSSLKEKERISLIVKSFTNLAVPVRVKNISDRSQVNAIVKETESTGILFVGAMDTENTGRSLFGDLTDKIAMAVKCPVAVVKAVKKDKAGTISPGSGVQPAYVQRVKKRRKPK